MTIVLQGPARPAASVKLTMTHIRPGGSPAALLVLCTLFLAACAGAPGRDGPDVPQAPPEDALTPAAPLEMRLPPSAFEPVFRAAESALDRGDTLSAELELDLLAGAALSASDAQYLRYLQARQTYIGGDAGNAREQLTVLLVQQTHPGVRYRALSLLAHLAYLEGRYIASARAIQDLLDLGALANSAAWERQLWRALQRAEVDDLFAAEAGPDERQWQGWLALAIATRGTGFARDRALARWLGEYPDHTARGALPGGLQQLQAAPRRAARAVLLLPLSGRLEPAGRAVLDGYLAAHYAARMRGEPTAELTVLDESDFPSALAAYEQAVLAGADIVIGPLNKLGVAELGTQAERPVPVLALNRTEQLLPASGSALVQLSLAPEDEAGQLADYAFGEGARRAVILGPRGPWGDELRAVLGARWTALGGRVVASASYVDAKEYSPSIERALGLADSNARARVVEDLLDMPLESTPRRRRDADAVFLLVRNSAQAKALKPLLAFHYAGDLPVYALSSAYSGVTRGEDRDLRGVRLLETPWLLAEQDELRDTLRHASLAGGAYPRLNALGVDAYLLQAEFPRLAAGPDALVRGSTGLLSMDPQLHIQRELTPAVFDGDTVRPR